MDSPEAGESYFNRRRVVWCGCEHCNGCGVTGDSWALDTSSSTRLSAAFFQSDKNGNSQRSVVKHRYRYENRGIHVLSPQSSRAFETDRQLGQAGEFDGIICDGGMTFAVTSNAS